MLSTKIKNFFRHGCRRVRGDTGNVPTAFMAQLTLIQVGREYYFCAHCGSNKCRNAIKRREARPMTGEEVERLKRLSDAEARRYARRYPYSAITTGADFPSAPPAPPPKKP